MKNWSSRFDEGLNPFIEKFNASIEFDISLLQEDLDCSIVHAQMLGRQGIISPAEAIQIQKGLEQIRQESLQEKFPTEVTAEDVHYAVENRLIEIIGAVGKKLHSGRSRNDQVGTDLRLWLRRKIDQIDQKLNCLQRILLITAQKNIQTLIPGYTHLQRAQPLSLAHHLLAYIEMFQRDRDRLVDVRKRVNISPLGAAALAGTSLPIDRLFTSKELGFEDIYYNSLDAVSDRDFAVEFSSAAALIMVHLSRLSEEIILWASDEFAFVSLTDRCATGSSLMPQKKNPDVPELIRGKSGRVFGHLIGLLSIMKGLPMAYNKDLQEDKEPLFDTVKTVMNAVEAMSIVFDEGLEFLKDNLSEKVSSDFSNATDVADYLVKKGIPFRQAYEIVGALVKLCIKRDILLRDLTLNEWKEISPAFSEDIFDRLIPQQVVASRTSLGGTSFERVAEQLENWTSRLNS